MRNHTNNNIYNLADISPFVEKKEIGHVRNSPVVQDCLWYLARGLYLHRGRVGFYLGMDSAKIQVFLSQRPEASWSHEEKTSLRFLSIN